jgi:uncharacterized protein
MAPRNMTTSIWFIPSLAKRLAIQKEYWSCYRILRGLLYLPSLFMTVPFLFDFLKILSRPSMRGLLAAQPMLPFKYLSRFYMAQGLSTQSRALAITHHYRFFHAKFQDTLLRTILHGRTSVFEIRQETHLFRICLASSPSLVKEGELSLYLQVDGTDVYVLSFSFVPGKLVGMTTETVMLITRLQGMRGVFPQIRDATKALHDISPPALLISALQGLAKALEIRRMAGVSAADQVCKARRNAPELGNAYDLFFAAIGAQRNALNFYIGNFPLPEKPIHLVKPDHRSRTLRKRKFKAEVSEKVYECISGSRTISPAYLAAPASAFLAPATPN